ncbi:MAG: hypothetical protein HXY34_05365 [Candidatus Thorarchaeota archaeon]|nr:hypothetical protein [Candidatus Thorarchaeota archaeon]
MTVFTPPGLVVESAKYPTLLAGVLASTAAHEHLAVYDHCDSWGGLDREAIAAMRRNLYRFVLPVNARDLEPESIIRVLQTVALSVTPMALRVEVSALPPRTLEPSFGLLPAGPLIHTRSFELLSEPEISRVASRLSERDIPASEAVWQLFEYDYSLDQVARMFAVGLLGRLSSRRLVPLRGAYRAVIDAFTTRAISELNEAPTTDSFSIQTGSALGERLVMFSWPGGPKVDYLRMEFSSQGRSTAQSMDSTSSPNSDPKTTLCAAYARFGAYRALLREKVRRHVVIFHSANAAENSMLSPWITRAAVADATNSEPMVMDSAGEALEALKGLLTPPLECWTSQMDLQSRLRG